MSTVLIVEDEARIASFLTKGLKAAGFTPRVVTRGEQAVEAVLMGGVDLVLLDVGLPDIDGFEVLERLRGQGVRTPIIMLTAKGEDVDRIVGIAHIKDLIGPTIDHHAAGEGIKRYMRKPDFVPDTKDIIPLLSEMRGAHDQMVIVVDEYGGTAGVITVEDIVEEVVGEIEDEFDPDNKYLTQLGEREWLVDGRFSVDDAIELGWPIKDSDEYETIAGFVIDVADGLPRPGDEFTVDGYVFHVQSMRRRRVSLLRVSAPEPTDTAEEQVVGGEQDEEGENR